MKKYQFLVQKIQQARITKHCLENQTLDDVLNTIEEMSEEELEFSEPQYQLIGISKDSGKISKIIWMISKL